MRSAQYPSNQQKHQPARSCCFFTCIGIGHARYWCSRATEGVAIPELVGDLRALTGCV